MVAVYHVLWGDSFLACSLGDGHTVLVAAAYEHHLTFLCTEVAHVYVGRHVDTCQMSYMNTAIGVG